MKELFKCINPVHPLKIEMVYWGELENMFGVDRVTIKHDGLKVSHWASRFVRVTFSTYNERSK